MYAKVSKKGQITIPKKIRELLKIEKQGNVLFVVENDDIKLMGIPVSNAEELSGSLKKYAKSYVELSKVREDIGMEVAEDIAKEDL
ncbi:MAG: AbrB/MazE/SpoVT family DNA-binding domain-containing protein [Deltaproteobacteria bacterium]|jgi:antitoxin PrlF|nr:AbrB/MazE/SpoVT family DNA-binding domain-containing protein [Deltaproteobacteria bacterium]MBT4528129.1 AbrB/MazE/SpoVT family DNA-binding domain-containing protein [Deltaproteobacteria bacterium]